MNSLKDIIQTLFFQTNKRNQNCKLIRKAIKGSEHKSRLSLRTVSVFTLRMIWNKNLYRLGIFFQIPLSGFALIQTDPGDLLLLGDADQEPRERPACQGQWPAAVASRRHLVFGSGARGGIQHYHVRAWMYPLKKWGGVLSDWRN